MSSEENVVFQANQVTAEAETGLNNSTEASAAPSQNDQLQL